MIAPETIAEIRRLLAERGHSQREIARQMGVCRGSVGAIASGRRSNGGDSSTPREDDFAVLSGPPVRCPGCGAMVYMPCVLCHVRSKLRKGPRIMQTGVSRSSEESLYLNLRPEHRARYEEVRRRRETETAGETRRQGDKET
jgi:hypothetical protein